MNRSVIVRSLALVAILVGMTMTVLAGSASAQVVDSVRPAISIQRTGQIEVTPRASESSTQGVVIDDQGTTNPAVTAPSGEVGTLQAEQCGYWVQYDSYYTHCGYNSIVIHVDFAFSPDRQITVWPGRTDLSRHWALRSQGGWIYNAYCIQRC